MIQRKDVWTPMAHLLCAMSPHTLGKRGGTCLLKMQIYYVAYYILALRQYFSGSIVLIINYLAPQESYSDSYINSYFSLG